MLDTNTKPRSKSQNFDLLQQTGGTTTVDLSAPRQMMLDYVDRFVAAVGAIPRTPRGDAAVPAALTQLQGSMKGLALAAEDQQVPVNQNLVMPAFQCLEAATQRFECFVTQALALQNLTVGPSTEFYQTLLTAQLSEAADLAILKRNFADGDLPGILESEGMTPGITDAQVADFQAGFALELGGLKATLAQIAKVVVNPLVVIGLNKFLGATAAGAIVTIAKAFTTIDQMENFDMTPKLGVDRKISVRASILSVTTDGNFGDDLQLLFSVAGQNIPVIERRLSGPIGSPLMLSQNVVRKGIEVSVSVANRDDGSFDPDATVGSSDRRVDPDPGSDLSTLLLDVVALDNDETLQRITVEVLLRKMVKT